MTSAAPLPLQQHAYFGNALGLLGRQVHVLALPSAAPVLAVRQFGQLMTSRGPIWQGGAAPSADMLRTSGLRVVNTDAPDASTLTQAGYRMIITPAYVAELDLSRPPNVRINHAKAKWRNIWRRSQDTPVVIKEACFDPANHQWLLDADNRQQRQKRFRGLPHALISAYAACHPQDVPVFVAFEDDTPIAAMLFLLHRPIATYHLGWTSARGRQVGHQDQKENPLHRRLHAAGRRHGRDGLDCRVRGTAERDFPAPSGRCSAPRFQGGGRQH